MAEESPIVSTHFLKVLCSTLRKALRRNFKLTQVEMRHKVITHDAAVWAVSHELNRDMVGGM